MQATRRLSEEDLRWLQRTMDTLSKRLGAGTTVTLERETGMQQQQAAAATSKEAAAEGARPLTVAEAASATGPVFRVEWQREQQQQQGQAQEQQRAKR